jgi:hypothetical protein
MFKRDKMPKEVYVTREYGEDYSWLIISETLDPFEADDTVGVYVLKETRKLRVDRILE